LDNFYSHWPFKTIVSGNSMHCLRLSKAMFDRGVNVQPILHPAVEESASRLRYFITACHTEAQLRYTIDAMVEELEKIDPSHLARAKSGATVAG
jgi:7-keto-8-aminopelargonate synthetase-like enzyme